ncbi:hypothetical protein PP641_gp065 [Arthrobacter phage SilentRX]|uniref:Uncharacterized protein n=1 Tax=Arthrobacter phage SilentRX TaxID=2836091 RepID=A0A8F3INL7_9CAUD|nr:hypothetical protein PP641_gp065 [Arthrobacter phage SilentRX]QWY82805.1 hypothetical protein SEA_SILENTRX_65 [Arthrobacter phage SilentRX]
MGMQDQYDDGRYDPVPDEDYGYYPGPYGRRTPYKKSKGTHTMTTASDRIELQKALDLRETLNQRISLLQEKVAQRPAEPGAAHGDAFAIDVKYSTRGTRYRFLFQRGPKGGWFSTGQKSDNSYFPTWDALVDWLNGPDVAWYSSMVALNMGPIVMDGSK